MAHKEIGKSTLIQEKTVIDINTEIMPTEDVGVTE